MDIRFSKGADLWILPEIKDDFIRRKIEWAVNFQIAKSLEHSQPEFSAKARSFFDEVEASEFGEHSTSASPWTMISVEGLLPAKWLIFSSDLELRRLGREIDQVWLGLNRPSTRIFSSQVWTNQALKELKSECLKAETTEIINLGADE